MPSVAKCKKRHVGEDSYFYSLVKPATPKKKRVCLKCGTAFMSSHYGNRVCGSCAAQNARAAVRAEQTF